MGKRSSPGADKERNPPNLFDVDIDEGVIKKLQSVKDDIASVELAVERDGVLRLAAAYAKRREILKTIPKFWPVAFMNCSSIAVIVQHAEDQQALTYLEDVWVVRDEVEHRAFILELHFAENPYFSDRVLKKQYKYIKPSEYKDEKADVNGIKRSALEFEWDRDIHPQTIKISWKDDSKNLTKLYPAKTDEDDVVEVGSFFNLFEVPLGDSDIGPFVANEVFPEAIEWFTGEASDSISGIDSDEDSIDDDEDADEIDLEKPRAKKARVGAH